MSELPTPLAGPFAGPSPSPSDAPGAPAPATPDPEAVPSRRQRWLAAWPEAVLVLGAFVLYAWALDRNWTGNAYYAAAARSSLASWKDLWYGSLDPGGWITVDKPPLALWLQGLSARAFGYSSWSLLLPSAACGALAAGLLAATVRRTVGPQGGRSAGLVAGGVLALTPVMMAVSRSNNPDAVLVLALVAAAYATQRAISERKPGWMILAGVLCGVGFLGKLLVAAMIMPALWGAYLLTGPGSVWRRVRDLVLAFVAFVGVAAVWVATVDLVPASARPFIGGSTDGSALDLVFGYNGLGRITGRSAPGGGGGPGGGGPGGGASSAFGGATGPLRLFNPGMGDQAMWLVAFAVAALVVGLALAIRRRDRGPRTGALVLWGGWLATMYVTFAFASGIYHNYYVSALAPSVAALVGLGIDVIRRAGQAGAAAVAVTALATIPVEVVLLDRVPAYEWLRVAIPLGLVVVAVAAVLVALRPEPASVPAASSGVPDPAPPAGPRARSWSTGKAVGAVALAAVAVAVVPAAIWTWSGTHTVQGSLPEVRPAEAAGTGGGFGGPGGGGPGGGAPGGGFGGAPGGGAAGGGFGGGLSTAELQWLRSQSGDARWILAVQSSMQADTAIIDGWSVMAMGGFSGSDPAMTQAKLAALVERGELRFVSAGGGFGGGFGGPGGGFGGPGGGGSAGISQIVTQACTPVSATQWGGTGTSSVYDCKGKAAAIRAVTGTSAGTSAGGGSQVPPAGGTGGQGFVAVQQCLAERGIDVSNGPPNASDPAVAKALEACGAQTLNGQPPTGVGGP